MREVNSFVHLQLSQVGLCQQDGEMSTYEDVPAILSWQLLEYTEAGWYIFQGDFAEE